MKTKSLAALAAVALSATLSVAAHAQVATTAPAPQFKPQHAQKHGDHRQSPVYAGFSLGTSSSDIDGFERSKPSYGLTLGTQLNKTFAVETAYQNFGSREFDGGKAKFDALSLALVGGTPIAKDVRLYGKAGIARTSISSGVSGVDVGLSDTGLVLGGGVEWQLARNVSLRGGVDVFPDFAGSGQTVSNFGIGANYRF